MWIIGSLVVVIALGATAFLFVFDVQHTQVNWLTTSVVYDTLDNDGILQSAEFEEGDSIFFVDKQTATNKIEVAYPYLKVVGIETVFPNKLVVNVAEREALFAVEQEEQYYLLDEEMKVLQMQTEIDFSDNSSVVQLQVQEETLSQIDFVIGHKVDKLQQFASLSGLGNGLARLDMNTVQARAWMKQVTVSKTLDRVTLQIETDWGLLVQLEDSETDFFDKLHTGYSLFVYYHDANPPQNEGTILVFEAASGEIEASFVAAEV